MGLFHTRAGSTRLGLSDLRLYYNRAAPQAAYILSLLCY